MRTLLIDNYDSFTYNLYQYLAACNGQAPLVVRNDELTWEELESLDFDNIVISPGPGRPQHASDLGLSADVLQRSDKPVLGVCLGHQAIAHHCGAKVDLAVRPMHGRIDRIFHGQREIFRGIPDRFEAVRYHSLAVSELPGDIVPLAWAGDGTLMALRHQSRPWWGVQFHPESICSEYGARLLRNFHDLTVEWMAAPQRTSTFGSFVPETRHGSDALHVHASCIDAMRAPNEVFTEVFGGSPEAFWLDSSLADGERSRFSFMGDASGPRAELLRYRSSARELHIRRAGVDHVLQQSIFDYLKARLRSAPVGQAQLPFDFSGGYVGYFGYELKQELGAQRAHEAGTPDACWIFADRFLAFDHMLEQTWIVCLDGPLPSDANREWMKAMEAVSRLTSFMHRFKAIGLAATVGFGLLLASHSAQAENAAAWPDKPVRLVLPYPPGGNVDGAARIISDQLQAIFKQPFLVDNKPGAGGLIAGEFVAKAAPDGYTFFMGANGPILFSPTIFKRDAYDWRRDFVPVTSVSFTPLVLQVNPSTPYKTIGELIEAGKKPGNKLTMASPGAGTQNHLVSEYLQRESGAHWTTVCGRRLNLDHPCRLNLDQGTGAGFSSAGCA